MSVRTKYHLALWVAWPLSGAIMMALSGFVFAGFFLLLIPIALGLTHYLEHLKCPNCFHYLAKTKYRFGSVEVRRFWLPRECPYCGGPLDGICRCDV